MERATPKDLIAQVTCYPAHFATQESKKILVGVKLSNVTNSAIDEYP
jgi:hypothetical protein